MDLLQPLSYPRTWVASIRYGYAKEKENPRGKIPRITTVPCWNRKPSKERSQMTEAGRRPEKGPKREEQVSKFRTSIPEDRE
jgi:hypothetical protein